jgi:transcription factor IIIB 90 kDa subunit
VYAQVANPTGRRIISLIASRLNLNGNQIEAAQRLFVLALKRNFTQGRKTHNVIAACLYVVCRKEKTARWHPLPVS